MPFFKHRYFSDSSSNQRSKVVKENIIASLFVKGGSIVVSLILVPLTLGYVSSELYGIWLTLSSIMLWLNFFDVGFTLGLKNRLAEAIAMDDWERGKFLVSTTYFMMIIFFVPLCIALEIIIPFVNWSNFLNVSADYNDEIIKAMCVLVGCFCIQMIANVLVSVAASFQKVALSSSFPVIGHALSVFIIWLLILFCPPSLLYLSLAISVTPILIVGIASIYLYRNSFSKVSPNTKSVRWKYVGDLFKLGYKFFLIQIQVVVLYQTTNVLISNLSGPDDVTSYNIAYKYLSVAMMVFTIILNPIWPAFTDAYTKGDYDWMKVIYCKMKRVYMLSVLIMLIMVIMSPFSYYLWIGNQAEVPFLMTVLVFIYMTVFSWSSLQVNMINGIGTIKLQTYVVLIGLVLHIPLSFFIGKFLGAYGVIISMLIINCIYALLFTVQIRRILNKQAKGIWIE